jgi:KaiC/GvpD/RAD55 family RecA-like ATPase
MFKNSIPLLLAIILMSSCGQDPSIEKAETALDGGRYFLESLHQGDIKKAKLYILDNVNNRLVFDSLTKAYFSLDKEGRQQLRQASIQINEVEEINQSASIIHYQLSSDPEKKNLKVVATKDGWRVDLK